MQGWNGNLYNNLSELIYTTDSIDYIYSINEQTSIENTVTIVQRNNLDKIVETDYRIEKYAPEIGLIYKEILILTDVFRKNEDGTIDIYEIKLMPELSEVIEWDLGIHLHT